jgi:hypothetical protein
MTRDLVSTESVLDSVLGTFERWIEPELSDPYVRSLAITVRQLIRHCRVRVAAEGRLLWEDNHDLREVLTALAAREPELGVSIRATLDSCRRPAGEYPDVGSLRHEADALRRCLSDVIDDLWSRDDAQSHRRVREYLSRQLMRESVWTTEVFVGARR